MSPKKENWDKAVEYWKTLKTDADAKFDKEINLTAEDIVPMVTWGTSPQDVAPINGKVPNPENESDIDKMSYSKLEFLHKLFLPNRIETDQDKMKSDIAIHLKESKLDSLQKITNAHSSLSKNFAAYSDSLSKSSKFLFQEKLDSLKRVFTLKQKTQSLPNSRNVATPSRKPNTSRGSIKTR